ncbi:hypothetical protein RND81_11G200600 [Saponaria officinalis]|uniref:Cytochrome P450 n=1 Tax=Saponaria officinalis TaxID=3572 RepID=A0AAW1HPH6_SAPOF
MEFWFMFIVTASIAALINALFSVFKPNSNHPPGPRGIPVLSSVLWLRKSLTEMEYILKNLRAKFGPIVTLQIGSRPLIFISSRKLAHQALIQNGSIFADRPEPPLTGKITSSNQHNISSAGYGSTWRTLRRNLTSQILHPSKSKEFSGARKWALDVLLNRLKNDEGNLSGGIKVVDHFRFAMFCLLVYMCFGTEMDESSVKEVEEVVHRPLLSYGRYQILNFWPRVTRVLLRSRWNEFLNSRKDQEEVLLPYIRARIRSRDSDKKVSSYLDTLLEIELFEDGNTKRKLTEEEIVTTCSEFLTGGTDTTSTALQWIMANLVKYPNIQGTLYEEIKEVVGKEAEEVREDEVKKMPYLKAVILEGLRRHPPGHFVLPHAVTQEVELGGYTVPKNAIINFIVTEMNWDPEVWEDPMEFKPERFMSSDEEFDVTGNREIKMMPFGAGRRICPASGLAMLHLEYFVANLVSKFEWRGVEGKEVDLTEKPEFTIVMKNPLHAHISPR